MVAYAAPIVSPAEHATGTPLRARIPRIIHQTWKSRDVPEAHRAYQARWIELHPSFEYRLWTDEDNDDFVASYFPELVALYRSFDRDISRADLVRYLYLARFGGIYVDLDIEPLVALDAFLDVSGECVLGSEPDAHAKRLFERDRLACNAAMASVAGHPFWNRVVQEVTARAALRLSSDPVWVTGPRALDAAYFRYGAALGVRIAEPNRFFPMPDITNQDLHLRRREIVHFRRMSALGLYPAESLAVHHWAHTWIPTHRMKQFFLRVRNAMHDTSAVATGKKTVDEVLRPERYSVSFPEAAFPPRANRASEYRRAVELGKRRASASSIGILVMLRDRIDLALLLRARVEAMARSFGRARVHVMGSDSTDGTSEVLLDWSRSRPELAAIVQQPEPSTSTSVYSRMARFRNALLAAAEPEGYDYIAVLDGDLEGPISTDGLFHSIALLSDAGGPDGVAAFGVNNWLGVPFMLPFAGYSYYDPLALREREWARVQSDARVRLRLSRLRRGDPPLPVRSAFAGLTLYRAASVRGLRYDEDATDCEHVGFHRSLRLRGGKLVVNPSLLLLAGRQGHHLEASQRSAATLAFR
jgi:hypothetical protein